MAFNKQRFVRHTLANNAGQITTLENPSIVPVIANGPALFAYASATDNLATISAANYFSSVVYDLAINDRIDASGSDGSAFYIVSAVDRDLATVAVDLYLSGGSGNGNIVTPTITDHIIVALDNIGTIGNILSNQNKTAKFNGNIQAGLEDPGNPGEFTCYSSAGAAGGELTIECNANEGAVRVTIENSSHEQSSAYLIPDCGTLSCNFLVSKFPGTQVQSVGNFEVSDGSITARTDLISSLTGGLTGLYLRHVNPGGNFNAIISNDVMTIGTTYTIPNTGVPASKFIVSDAIGGQIIATGDVDINNNLGVGGYVLTDDHFLARSPTASSGGVKVMGVDTASNFMPFIINQDMLQDTGYVIPDAGIPLAAFVVSPSPKIVQSGEASQNSTGTSNIIVDPFCMLGTRVVANFSTQTNPASILTVLPGGGSFTVVTDADPGDFSINYIIFKEKSF